MADFGAGLGAIIGNSMAKDTLDNAGQATGATSAGFQSTTAPFVQFGQSFLPQIGSAVNGASSFASGTKSYDDFMKDYTASPGAQYLMDQGREAQDLSASSTGQLLSGTNGRAQETIRQGIAGTQANQAYGSYLAGNNQQFGQLESIIGNMFTGAGTGLTATGQNASVVNSQMQQQSALAQKEAEADKGKGGGIGSLFSGIGSIATMF
jgi:hypothetical protein